jgi:hypothetical protein
MVLPELTEDRADPAPRIVTAWRGLVVDADRDVRNWATFGLGWGMDADTPAIRRARRAYL